MICTLILVSKWSFFTKYIGVLPNKNMSIILAMAKECNVPDEVAEWLRRWTANPLGSPRVGSNPILVERKIFMFVECSKGLQVDIA